MQSENRKDFDLDRLLHPAGAFRTPMEVVNDPDMTTQEKRAILASWASDACAVEAAPDLRQPTDTSPIRFDDIIDALKRLEEPAAVAARRGLPLDEVAPAALVKALLNQKAGV